VLYKGIDRGLGQIRGVLRGGFGVQTPLPLFEKNFSIC